MALTRKQRDQISQIFLASIKLEASESERDILNIFLLKSSEARGLLVELALWY